MIWTKTSLNPIKIQNRLGHSLIWAELSNPQKNLEVALSDLKSSLIGSKKLLESSENSRDCNAGSQHPLGNSLIGKENGGGLVFCLPFFLHVLKGKIADLDS